MEPAKNRGRTTQNCAPAFSSGSASRFIRTVTCTRLRSAVRAIFCTSPMSTSLCLTWDWFACRPSAVSKVMVINGPRWEIVCHASQPPMMIVTMGIAQSSDILDRTTADGCCSLMRRPRASGRHPTSAADRNCGKRAWSGSRRPRTRSRRGRGKRLPAFRIAPKRPGSTP